MENRQYQRYTDSRDHPMSFAEDRSRGFSSNNDGKYGSEHTRYQHSGGKHRNDNANSSNQGEANSCSKMKSRSRSRSISPRGGSGVAVRTVYQGEDASPSSSPQSSCRLGNDRHKGQRRHSTDRSISADYPLHSNDSRDDDAGDDTSNRSRRSSPDYSAPYQERSVDRREEDGRNTLNHNNAAPDSGCSSSKKQITPGVMFEALERQKVRVSWEAAESSSSSKQLPKNFETMEDARAELASSVCDALEAEGFSRMTPVQKHSFPIVNRGLSLVACAQTGCGKTLAYVCPIVSRLIQQGQMFRPYFAGKNAQVTPLALVLCPTRELAIQINEQVLLMIKGSSLQAGVFYGGETVNEQIVSIINNHQCDITVCTPGRILDLCDACKISLSFVSILTLDEADIMLSMGFDKQLRAIIDERDLPDKNSRQTLLFSATFPPKIRQLTFDFLPHPFVNILVAASSSSGGMGFSSSGSRSGSGRGGRFDDEDDGADSSYPIKQVVRFVEDRDKLPRLLEDMRENNSSKTIVFVAQRTVTYAVNKTLATNGYESECMHGKMDQIERQEVFNSFRDDEFKVLVATSIAARGLDIPGVTLVINFDMPSVFDQYTHRIGRTGRIGHEGLAISYVNNNDRPIANKLYNHLLHTKQIIPEFLCNMTGRRYRPPRSGGDFRGQDFRERGGHSERFYHYDRYDRASHEHRRYEGCSSGAPRYDRARESPGTFGWRQEYGSYSDYRGRRRGGSDTY